MWLRSFKDQAFEIPGLDLTVELKEGEEIRTELSTKYDQVLVEDLLTTCGFETVKCYTDPNKLIGLVLAQKP